MDNRSNTTTEVQLDFYEELDRSLDERLRNVEATNLTGCIVSRGFHHDRVHGLYVGNGSTFTSL